MVLIVLYGVIIYRLKQEGCCTIYAVLTWSVSQIVCSTSKAIPINRAIISLHDIIEAGCVTGLANLDKDWAQYNDPFRIRISVLKFSQTVHIIYCIVGRYFLKYK